MAPNSTTHSTGTETVSSDGYRDLIVVYLKGCAMGAADAVPGVSGGTIALITGIYERLIRAITNIDPGLLRTCVRLHRSNGRSEFRAECFERDVPFLLALGVGMLTAVILIARVVTVALEAVPGQTFAFFAGLIGASAVVLFEREWLESPRYVVAGVAGFAVAFLIAGASGAEVFGHSHLMIFLAGAVAICGLILPGISGAFILLLLGQYGYLAGVLTRFVDGMLGLAVGGGTDGLVADGGIVLTFMAGAAVGLLTIARLVRLALEVDRETTFVFLVSLMVGALRYPIERVLESAVPSPTVAASIFLAGVVGVVLVMLLDRYTDDLSYSTDDSSTGF